MNFHLRCRCKPHVQIHTHVVDARRAAPYDPTGTNYIQKKFDKEFAIRWQRVRKMIPDIIGIRTNAANNIQHAIITGNNQVQAFQNWLDEALRQFVLGINGFWTTTYIRQAGDLALATSSKTLAGRVTTMASPADRVPLLQSLTITELQGIIEAVSQQSVRAFGNGLLTSQSPPRIARAIQQIIDATGKRRSRLLTSFMLVRTHAAVTLDAFRASGVASVGTIAERAGAGLRSPSPVLARDARKKSKKVEEDLVNILTAGDDKVCQDCQDISDDGPYDLNEAESLIPNHPNCRCLFVPWDDARFAEHEQSDDLGDEFNEADHPRDDDGKWTDAGGGSSSTPKQYPQGDIHQSIAELKKDSPKFFGTRTFTDNEINSVNNYIKFIEPEFGSKTNTGFEAINSNLRKNASYKSSHITNLDSAISKSIAPHDHIVYRGIGNTLANKISEQWDEHGKAEFKDNAYVSTSVNKKRASSFSKNVMEIKVAKGSKALPIDWNKEGEILLGRGNRFRVTNVKKTATGNRRITAELL